MTDFGTITSLPSGLLLAKRYKIERVIGQGGMGVVYLADDLILQNEPRAIKTIRPELIQDPRCARQLKSEAVASLRLAHPNIIRLINYEEWEGIPFLVMEYVEGITLAEDLSNKERLTQDEFLPLAEQMCAGLDYSHKQGILHGDLKPSNVFLYNAGRVKLADFGVARIVKDATTRITGQLPSGTLLYMSPEYLDGESPTVAGDIYSLGIVFYEMLNGEPPFVRGDIYRQHHSKRPEPISGINGALNAAILQALEKNPKLRQRDVATLQAQLTAVREPTRIAAQPPTPTVDKPPIDAGDTRPQVTSASNSESPGRAPAWKQPWCAPTDWRSDQFHQIFKSDKRFFKIPIIGIFILLLGASFLMRNLGAGFHLLDIDKLWPLLVILVGVNLLLSRSFAGVVVIAVGGYFFLRSHGFWWPFMDIGTLWPLFLVLIGISFLFKKH